MKSLQTIFVIAIVLTSSTYTFCQTTPKDFPVLKGPYLGQTPPGMKPKIFAPGIVSIPKTTEWSSSFSPDGKEFYFYRVTVISEKPILNIYVSKLENGKWTPPVEVEFAKGYNAGTPHVTLDNNTLYFGWWRPDPAGDPEFMSGRVGRIWYAERTVNGWSEPHYAGQGMFTSSDRNGNLYTTDMSSRNINGKTYIAMVIRENGRFKIFEKINITPIFDEPAHPCIAPDGTYLLFDVDGGSHLLVSFKKKDGTWGEAIDLTKHGFDVMAGGATISPDGSKIAFASMRDGNFEIYVMNTDGSNQVRLTNNSAEDRNVDWSPDGSRLAFVSERDGHSEIYIMNADGTNQTRLTYTNGRAINPEWKPITIPDTTVVKDSISINIRSGWNMISIPVDSAYLKNNLFPYSISSAYFYDPDSAHYVMKDTLETGKAYWLKFPSSGISKLYGDSVYVDSFDVKPGWNMIGSISKPVPVDNIGSDPPRMITSNFFTYQSGYDIRDTIFPGIGYWIKVDQPGQLILSSSELLPPSQRIRIEYVNEEPTLPPPSVLSMDDRAVPLRFVLYQNYPNPFNPSTNIRFDIPARNHVRLDVFNILGSLVKTLLDEVKDVGSYSIMWDGMDNKGHMLPTGLYYYRLKSGNLCQTQKALIIK